jgi:16S rRNA (cytosine967-C5)-methyltransferase
MVSAGEKSRAAAHKLLVQVLDRGQLFADAWATALSEGGALRGLPPRDRAFVRLLTGTVLRRLGQLDDAIGKCLSRPLNRNGRPALNILRLAAAQMLFLDTPPHAAVDGAVRQARRRPHLKGLVNAVARRLAREGSAIVADQDAAALNCPDWLSRSWSDCYGEETARRIIEACLIEPALDLSLKTGGNRAEWQQKLSAQELPTGSLRRAAGGRIEDLPGYDEGMWWIQDAAAALPAQLLGDIGGHEVIDLCAAPGGKTAQLADKGGKVTAVDASEARLERLQDNLLRLRLTVNTVCADAARWRPAKRVPFILLDAPCSSTGTVRRHPDIWHLKKPADVASMAALQTDLLNAAVDMLAPGGTLIYCTCSLQPEEGPARIAQLLAENASVSRLPIGAQEVGGQQEFITSDGDIRTLPQQMGGIDGFFISRLRVADQPVT